MVNSNYAKACNEILEIIKYFPEEEYNKIPKEKIRFFEANMDKTYQFAINPTISLSEQNISKEAYAILVILFQDYFATEEQKDIIKEILKLNQQKLEKEKRDKYNPNDLFKSANKIVKIQNREQQITVKYKEKFFIKFKKIILKLLHLKS